MSSFFKIAAATGIWALASVAFSPLGQAADGANTAETIVKVLKAGRAVVSDHQAVINDAAKGDKGFTGAAFEAKWKDKYKEVNKSDMPTDKVMMDLVQAGKAIVDDAQPIINKQGMGFKGFLPALWGRKTGEKFSKHTGIGLKQTSEHYRFAGNKPDDYEAEVLKQFSSAGHPKGKEVVKTVSMGGKQVLRFMSPEYAAKSCLSCHGDPKGEKDITGGKMEGYKEGDLAGAISVIVPIQ
jgi:general secretion pathway protein A